MAVLRADAVTVTVEAAPIAGGGPTASVYSGNTEEHGASRFIDFGRRIGRRVQCCWRRTRFRRAKF
ncbi:MAG: hypothetical protein IPL33_21065 [Sphingobacteriales bacterium]|nr:hypothetical protein [Sphingobacteriales bacterium]